MPGLVTGDQEERPSIFEGVLFLGGERRADNMYSDDSKREKDASESTSGE